MNRILIDEALNKIAKIDKNIVNFKIDNDMYLYLNNSYSSYYFNIENCNVNILIDDLTSIKVNFDIKNANVVLNIMNYDVISQNIDVNLLENGKIEIYNSCITSVESNININVKHRESNSKSNIYNCSVTKNDGTAKIKVISKVLKKSTSCVVNQDSKIISLNDTNKNSIEPILLIDEFDAEAKHSAFIGKFNEEDLFYMQSRGLSKKEAYNLLLNGFLVGIMDLSEEEKEILKGKINY